jgi:SAM-dependent methyltransferase
MFDESILLNFCKTFWCVPADVLQRSAEAMIWKKVKFTSPVLDIGCGNGEIDKLLFLKKGKIDVGVDSNKYELEKANKSGVYNKVVCADVCKLPLEKGKFNTVISNSTFEHIKDDEKALVEVSRVLKKDGHFYFTVPTNKLLAALKKSIPESEINWLNTRLAHFHFRSLEDWKKLLLKFGLKIVGTHCYVSPKLAEIWYKLLKAETFKPYRRELWSYLSDRRFSKFIPKNILSYLLFLYLKRQKSGFFTGDGVFLFLDTIKIK